MKRYDFGSEAKFHNVLLKEDTLILIGTSYDPASDPPQWGTLLVKMDTMGNVLGSSLVTGEDFYQYVFDAAYPFILTSENTYLSAGNVFAGGWFLQELDEAGNQLHFWEYPYYPELFAVIPKTIVKVEGGYLVFTTTQLDTYDLSVGIFKVDEDGEVLWERFFGEDGFNRGCGGVKIVDDNSYVIGSNNGKITSPYHPVSDWTQSWIFAIDSLGVMKWEWYSEENEHGYVRDIQQDTEGNWVYVTHQFGVFGPYEAGHQVMIVKRDPEMNLIWEAPIGDSWWFENVLYDLHPTPDGGWQAAGKIIQPEPYYGWAGQQGVQSWTTGAQVQLNAVGAINWIRRDTMVIQGDVSQSEFAGLVILPGGSSIAVGSYKEAGAGWRGWVVKTDRNGCVREDCFTGVPEVQGEEAEVRVYPNPADEFLHVELIEPFIRLARIEFYGSAGQLVFYEERLDRQSIMINTSGWAPGIYYFRLWTSEGNLHSGKVVVK